MSRNGSLWLEGFATWLICTFLIGFFPLIYPWLQGQLGVDTPLRGVLATAELPFIAVAICASIVLEEGQQIRVRWFGAQFCFIAIVFAGIAAFIYSEAIGAGITAAIKPGGQLPSLPPDFTRILILAILYALAVKLSESWREHKYYELISRR